MAAVTGLTGEVSSWNGTFNAALLALLAPAEFSLEMTGASLETTAFTPATGTQTVVATKIPGLREWRGSFAGSQATATNGIAGTVSGANYSTNVRAWEITMTAAELDTTVFQTANSWKTFAPGLVAWSGTYEALVDDTTLVAVPDVATVTATFSIDASNSWIGSIFTTGATVTGRVGDLFVVQYTFEGTGHLESSGTAAVLPDNNGTVATPAAGSLVLYARDNNGTNDRTYTGSAFWTRIAVSCRVGEVVRGTVNFRGTGALTPA